MARDSVKRYAEEKYGSDYVCSVGLWQTYNAKLALQDAATVLGYNRAEVIAVCKNLPEEFDKMPVEQAIEEFDNFRALAEDKPDVVRYAYKMTGKIKAQGKHAGGIIISDVPIKDYVPLTLCGDKDNKQWTSAWTEGMAATQLSKFGFVKFDLLGLRNISYIYNCKRLVRQNRGLSIDFEDIDPQNDKAGWITYSDEKKKVKIRLNDPKTLKAADKVKLDSIFQFDTDFQKSIVEKGGVKSFMDLVIYTSLGRPGPLPMIDVYIKNRNDPKERWKSKLHPKMLDILEETKGVLTFQEQLLRIWTEVCGFTMPEAEALQKAVKKKNMSILNETGPDVIKGAATVIGQKEAEEMWDKMVSFGRYCFNKCLSEDEVLVNPETNEYITAKKLYDNKKKFKLLSYNGKETFIDDMVDIHYNGQQEVFRVQFSNGIEQDVTIGHRFLNEFGEMEEAESLLGSGHALKYIRGSVTNVQEDKSSNRKTDRTQLPERDDLQADPRRCSLPELHHIESWDDYQSNQKTWSKEGVLNQSDQHGQPQLLREHRLAGEGLLVGDVDSRWLYSRGKRLCELAASSRGPIVSRAIWKRFEIAKKNIELSKRKICSSTANSKQQENGLRFEESGRFPGEIVQRNIAGHTVHITPATWFNGRGRLYCGQFQRLSDGEDRIEFCLFRETENHFNFRMWNSEIQDHQISEQFLCDLLDWLIPGTSDTKLSISRCDKISSKEEANGRCHIISVESLGVKSTYSPEMRSKHHNYITHPEHGIIHKNSHAVGYILIAYRCLWLKTHFPSEWWAAVLSECPAMRTVRYMGSARAEGINFGSISANRLTAHFSVNGEQVVPGVAGIKGIGKSAEKLATESGAGPFTNIDNFVERCGKSKTIVERLVKLGAFSEIYPNRKALWIYYRYKYDSSKDATAIRRTINHCYTWKENDIFQERGRQIEEFKRLYPRRTKIPPKIMNWLPSIPSDTPKDYDPTLELTKELIKAANKMKTSLSFEQITKLFPNDYILAELLEFEKEYLGYYWNSPLDMFHHKADTTIEHAKSTGVIECVIEESYVRQGARGDYRILNVTDGINTARVNVWSDVMEDNDPEVFEVGCGVKMFVNWQDKWRSFSAKRGRYIMQLEPIEV